MVALVLVLFFLWVVVAIARSAGGSKPRPSMESSARPAGKAAIDRIRLSTIGPRTYSFEPPTPEAAARESAACWMEVDRGVVVAERSIEGGLIYVGERLAALSGSGEEPSLINPRLPVAKGAVEPASVEMPYWPSYSGIDPRARAVLLDWLASGRRDPSVPIGYVFMFFYGLERRILFDSTNDESAKAELPVLLAEVRALLRIYGHNGSFRHYASSLLDYVSIRENGATAGEALEPPVDGEGRAIPFSVKVAVGKMIADGEPVAAEWALAWALHHPAISLRTAANRCPEEFRELFLIRYRETHGDGFRVKRNKTSLRVEHQPASRSIRRVEPIDTGLPDATLLTAPTKHLTRLVDSVQEELDRYSWWVGRNEDRSSLAALALLPSDLMMQRAGAGGGEFAAWLKNTVGGQQSVAIESKELVGRWPAAEPGKLRKQEAEAMADMMAGYGFGLEPDVRMGGANLSRLDRVVLFKGDAEVFAPDAAYRGASALLHLGAAVAAADDEVTEDEERFLEAHLEEGLGIKGPQRIRLRAHLQWLLSSPPTLASLRKKLSALPESQRHPVARFLLALAGADGHISSAELKVLGKVYPLLGLDPSTLSADVHELAVGGSLGPVTVIPSDRSSGDFAIPAATSEQAGTRLGVDLDLDRIARIRSETAEVAAVLDGIFTEADAEADGVPEEVGEAEESQTGGKEPPALPGLDAAHSQLVRALLERPVWGRDEFSRLAEQLGLMPAGAIESINEAAYAAFEEPLIEGDDPIELNPYALEELAA